jgi:type II secretion system protein G
MGFRRGFTLIELLVVVTVIAILAAIALPNFLEAQTRAKVSRVRADLRTMASSLEMYFVDLNTYPMDGNGGSYRGLVALTSPIAYQTSIAPDPFNSGYRDGYAADRTEVNTEINRARYYELGTGSLVSPTGFPAQVWALAAYGPDIDDDTDTIGAYPRTRRANPYDPTNGTTSDGDLYRLGPKDDHPNYRSNMNPLVF